MNNSIHFINRIVMGGRSGGFDTAALVDGHVHDYRTFLHIFQHLPGNQPGCCGPWNEDGSHHEIRFPQKLADRSRAGHQQKTVFGHDLTQIPQTLETGVEQVYLCAQTTSHHGRIGTHHAAAENQHRTGPYARHAAEQNTFAAICFLQILGPFLDSHFSGNFTHRCQQGKGTI